MNFHTVKLSRFRLSSTTLALIAALALPSAFAQSAPAPQPTDPSAAQAMQATPAQDATPAMQAATTTGSSTASAKPATFKELDVNKDGKLSKEEVAVDAMWTADFDAADTDKDGYLSKSEFKKHLADVRKTAKITGTQG